MNGTGKQSLVSSKKAEECNKRESSYLCCVSRYVQKTILNIIQNNTYIYCKLPKQQNTSFGK